MAQQEVFPEIQAATDALASRIALTETEISQLKEVIQTKREQLRAWNKALNAFNPRRAAKKKRATAAQQSSQ